MIQSLRPHRPIRATGTPTGSSAQECPDCLRPLTIHQPEIDVPDRLLGTCPDCHAWIIFDIDSDGMVAVTELPRHVG